MAWLTSPAGLAWDDNAEQMRCVNAANASPQVAAIDAQISSLSSTWKPTGYYRPAEISTVLAQLATEAEAAGAALAAAPRSTRDSEDTIADAFNDLISRYQARAGLYASDVATANANGINVIDAPAFKSFVIASMRAISDAYTTAYFMSCRMGLLETAGAALMGILDRAAAAMARIGSVVARILGVAYSAAKGALKAADKALGAIEWIIDNAPIIAVGGVVAYLVLRRRR